MKVLKFIGFGILFAAVIVLYIFIVMNLWNWIMPKVFGITTLTFWETAAVILLCKLLFFSAGGGKKSKCKKNKKVAMDKVWEERLKEKLQQKCSHQKNDNYEESNGN